MVLKVGGQNCNTTLRCSFARPLSSPFFGLDFGSAFEYCSLFEARCIRPKADLADSIAAGRRDWFVTEMYEREGELLYLRYCSVWGIAVGGDD